MKLISWNVNGLRACLNKGFLDFFAVEAPDFLALQETKMQPEQAQFELDDRYLKFWNSAEKKGYSGTAIFTPHKPIDVIYGLPQEHHNHEGRLITLEYESFYFVCCYTPNAQDGLRRLEYRMQWEDDLREYLLGLDGKKPVIYCGDLNVAHQEIDLKNPKANRKNAGFSDEERSKIAALLQSGFSDSFRVLHPDVTDAYSWWSYRFHAREKNAGWRIDYFLVSTRLCPHIKRAEILSEVYGSDHCPVLLELDLP